MADIILISCSYEGDNAWAQTTDTATDIVIFFLSGLSISEIFMNVLAHIFRSHLHNRRSSEFDRHIVLDKFRR